MAITAEGYYKAIEKHLQHDYVITKRDSGRIVLEEKVYWPGIDKPKDQKVRLNYTGEVLVVRLDQRNPSPLFHFLENNSKPWAQRCDFVIFQFVSNRLNVYCIELKSASLPESLVSQLNAGEAWCRSLHSVIKAYTGKCKRLNLRKFVFSSMPDPERFTDADGYYNKDHSIRHFHYDDLKGLSLEDLVNPNVETIG